MSQINNQNQSFKYLQDARQFALERPGSERIVKNPEGYQVEPLGELPTAESPPERESLLPNPFNQNALRDQLQQHVQGLGRADTTVEFLIDEGDNGLQVSDRQFLVRDGEVTEHEHRVGQRSERLLSPENKGLAIVREAIQTQRNERLLHLSPEMVQALRSAENLSPEEQTFVDQQFKTPAFEKAEALFVQYHGAQATFAAGGVSTYDGLMERLARPENQQNLSRLDEIARHPERFEAQFGGNPDQLASLAKTFKELPGFRRAPQAQQNDFSRPERRSFDRALRTIDQHEYKFRISHGMQFNSEGLSGYETEASYRWGDRTLTVGVGGKNYDFNNPFADELGNGINQIRAEYRSPDFDVRGGVKREADGSLDIISPKSDWADRFMDDRIEKGKGWAAENPWQAAAVGAGVAAGVWGLSYATGQDMSVNFDQRFNVIDTEHFRLRAEISPELHLNGGQPDLGLHGVGLGAMGSYGEFSYNATLRHRFDDTTIGTGKIEHKETDLHTRLAYRQYALETASRWDHRGDGDIRTEVGLRRNFALSASSSAYVRPHVQLDNGSYADAGGRVGWSKDFGNGLSLDLNAGYSENQGVSAGFRTSFQF